MNYLKVILNKHSKIYHFDNEFSYESNNPLTWIFLAFDGIDYTMLSNQKNLITQMEDDKFEGAGLFNDISIDYNPANNLCYIYDPRDESLPWGKVDQNHNLILREDNLFEFLNEKNSFTITKQNLIQILEVWKTVLSKISPYILIWQDSSNWVHIEPFGNEQTMNQRIAEIEKNFKA